VRNAFNIPQEKTFLTNNTEATKLTLYVQCTSFADHTIFGITAKKISERARIVVCGHFLTFFLSFPLRAFLQSITSFIPAYVTTLKKAYSS